MQLGKEHDHALAFEVLGILDLLVNSEITTSFEAFMTCYFHRNFDPAVGAPTVNLRPRQTMNIHKMMKQIILSFRPSFRNCYVSTLRLSTGEVVVEGKHEM